MLNSHLGATQYNHSLRRVKPGVEEGGTSTSFFIWPTNVKTSPGAELVTLQLQAHFPNH